MRNKNALFIGKVVHAFEELPSTNAYAQDLLSKSAPNEGTVVIAGRQTAGRGQIGSRWHSQAGKSLTFSVILFPRFLHARHQYALNLMASLALRGTIEAATALPAQVKWPNDVYLQGRKAAGILIQNALQGQRLQSSVLGFGINVNETTFPAGAENATSLRMATGAEQDREALLHAFLERLEQAYLRLKRSGQGLALREEYHQHMLGYRELRRFRRPGQPAFQASIQGIDTSGKLLLEHAEGKTAYGLKEIEFLFD